jgi:hypothetical protein
MKLQLTKILVVTAFLIATSTHLLAAKPERELVWYEGSLVTMIVVNANVVGVERESVEQIANALFSFGEPNAPQAEVISVAPGEAGYNPWWEEYNVVVLDGRDLTTDPFTSAEEILEAAEGGLVRIEETEFFFLCQIIFGGEG